VRLYERGSSTGRYELLLPKRTSLKHRVGPCADEGFLDFLTYLLAVDPGQRPTADEALLHPWLQHSYEEEVLSQ
jgi:dual specificity tyrosine-phosphorylation-regulated kinase 2/3/4